MPIFNWFNWFLILPDRARPLAGSCHAFFWAASMTPHPGPVLTASKFNVSACCGTSSLSLVPGWLLLLARWGTSIATTRHTVRVELTPRKPACCLLVGIVLRLQPTVRKKEKDAVPDIHTCRPSLTLMQSSAVCFGLLVLAHSGTTRLV
jgi:hypothetical protein